MDGTSFIAKLDKKPTMLPGESVFGAIWSEYERVIIQSLITSFGLDFLVHDQHGGDVDTIINARSIGFKNSKYEAAYEQRGEYDRHQYHEKDPYYHQRTQEAKENFNQKGIWIKDGYVPGVKVAYNKALQNKQLPDKKRAELDHVIAAKTIHDDPGRILAGLTGPELANNPDNLVFTNQHINNNMRDKSVEDYIEWCEKNPEQVNYRGNKGEPLPEEVKEKLRSEYKRAKDAYEAKLAQRYYSSPQFAKDTATAMGKRGAEMALRQALGFVFAEVWFSAKGELKALDEEKDLSDMLTAVGVGIQKGMENVKENHKEVFAKAAEGFSAGALSSLTTTLCNIFFTTAKSLVRCIRQVYASAVQAGKVILFNPDNLMLGDRIKETSVILATGASVLVGTAVGEMIIKTPVGSVPVIGHVVSTFCSTMVSGLLSCTLLVFLDRSRFVNTLIDTMNRIPSDANNFKEIADLMETLAAKIANIDIDQFKAETAKYNSVSQQLLSCEDEESLNTILQDAYERICISIPWEGDFDSFMSDKSNRLVFS